jgi:hypothetical protein
VYKRQLYLLPPLIADRAVFDALVAAVDDAARDVLA